MSSSTDTNATTVRRRRVFYIPGYDPFHPRRYRELYRKEGAAQAEISGYELKLSAKPGQGAQGRYGWHVEAEIEGAEVTTDVDVLVWSDIVRDSMNRGIAGTYLLMLRTAWTYISTGALFALMRLRKGPVIAALYPVGFLIVQAVIAVALAWGVGRLLALIHPWAAWVALAVIPVVLEWFRRKDNKFFAYYLMHDYAYSAQHLGADPPELKARMAEFTDEIALAFKEDADEILVVGHSSGAHIAVSVLADLIREGRVPEDGPTLSLLTLGQVVPMVAFLPKAHDLRRDLAYLCTRDEVTWVDVTAPGDGCAFALCDPVAVSGAAPEAGKRGPLVISAAFTQTLSPERWRALKRRYFRLHFQYLCAFDRPGDYDYFRITAGPRTLAQRFEGRNPSPSRIERPVNPYPQVTA
jgi:hypothetical protein